MFRILFGARIRGARKVPSSGPVVLLSNHESHFDPVLIGVFCPRQIAYMARSTLFTGLLGVLIRSYDAVPVDRDGSGLAGIRATLKRIKEGDAVLLFPEGARTQDGELQEFEPGFIALARRGSATIVPVGIDGAFEALPRGTNIPRLKRIAVCFGDPLLPESFANLSDEELLGLIREKVGAQRALAGTLTGHN